MSGGRAAGENTKPRTGARVTHLYLDSQSATDETVARSADTSGAPAPRPEPPPIIVGRVEGMTMFAKNT
ncbi:hypothetical protein, partial [Burkholderia sp. 22313]|uniref:hypothetical protein n=1 Tax=Burkholderia sp. 22313 TaxID=3453908 RepID=UPI003F84E5D1